VKPSTLSDWVKEFEPICRYARMRDFGIKLFSPHQVVQSVRLFHRQVFNFTYHKAKLALILQDYKHSQYEPLREFLDIIAVECPHQLFNESPRMSEIKQKFDLSQVLIREKHNFACRIAELVLQAVSDNKIRHETLQRFMLANDSVTVACEPPVYIDSIDIEYMRDNLRFMIPVDLSGLKTITGHIDILQVRNGELHILDYKPNAKKEKPIEQLTLYALALSRLTGIRLFNMKCAWFVKRAILKKIIPMIPDESPLKKDLSDCCMKIPHFIDEAHSRRFDDKPKSMKLMEETLFLCNKVVVDLEQARDIYGAEPKNAATAGAGTLSATAGGNIGIDRVVVEEIIKKYFYARQKVFNLDKAWKKFQAEKKPRGS
jgi:hypothetical protein